MGIRAGAGIRIIRREVPPTGPLAAVPSASHRPRRENLILAGRPLRGEFGSAGQLRDMLEEYYPPRNGQELADNLAEALSSFRGGKLNAWTDMKLRPGIIPSFDDTHYWITGLISKYQENHPNLSVIYGSEPTLPVSRLSFRFGGYEVRISLALKSPRGERTILIDIDRPGQRNQLCSLYMDSTSQSVHLAEDYTFPGDSYLGKVLFSNFLLDHRFFESFLDYVDLSGEPF
jgi:hypothetical protein